ncbi:MAG: thioesterase family protein [Anaerolineales bacterium]|jgi:predicted thioesterase
MEIRPGIKRTQKFIVKEEHTAFHIGSGSLRVLSTPTMIAFIENTALNLLDEYLETGFSSVGTRVDVRHLAPSKMGSQIRVQVEVTEVSGDKITLTVAAWDGETPVGAGTHQRYIIQVERFLQRLEPTER